MKTALLLLNGEAPSRLPALTNYDCVACTDGAYRYFIAHPNTRCDYVIGDFDSLTELPDAAGTAIIKAPDQNKTDMEKALDFLAEQAIFHVDIYGAGGKEHDHFLGNLSAALHRKNTMKITFFDDYHTYFLADLTTHLTKTKDRTISLIPFPHAENVTTAGLRYPLSNATLSLGQTLSLRNHAISDNVTIKYSGGALFLFIERRI